jgi:hypothetical protein
MDVAAGFASMGVLSNLYGQNARPKAQSARPTDNGGALWPSYESIEARLEGWSKQNSNTFKLETLGKTAQGRRLYAATLTDASISDDRKEHALITAMHTGDERSGATTVLYLIDWLLSNAPQARDILARQIVVCIPVVNPDGYVAGKAGNSLGLDPYSQWTLEGPKEPDKMPEAVAVKTIMDRLKPEVHADNHGAGLEFPGWFEIEESGRSYSNLSLRPYHYEICRLMDEAALVEGFASDGLEQDAERIFPGGTEGVEPGKLWNMVQTRVYAAIYCYNRYHSLILASEQFWERSSFLRLRRLLQVGNDVWHGEYYPGYPTRVITLNESHMVTAYGQTAAERRLSRVELWNKESQIVHGIVAPQSEGMAFFVCATSPAAVTKWLSDRSLRGFAAKIGQYPGVDADPIRKLAASHPDGPGTWGPQAYWRLKGGGAKPDATSPIELGLALRLRAPYPKARITDLRVNGHRLPPSEVNGYLTWVSRGCTYIQINIPPERSKAEDFFLVTCEYDPGEKRTQGVQSFNQEFFR